MERKTEVYSWRVSTATKARLEDAARDQQRPVAQFLEEIVTESLSREKGKEAERQRRLHARAARFAGRISGSQSRRSERVRTLVRQRLAGRRASAR